MKHRVPVFLILLALAVPAIGGGPIAWGGVGWYIKVQDTYAGAQAYAISGPHGDQAACDAAIIRSREEAQKAGYSARPMWCSYETVAWASPDYEEDEEW